MTAGALVAVLVLEGIGIAVAVAAVLELKRSAYRRRGESFDE